MFASKYSAAIALHEQLFPLSSFSHLVFGENHQTALGVSYFRYCNLYRRISSSVQNININQSNNSAVNSITMHNCHLNSPLKKRRTENAKKNFDIVTRPASHSISKMPPFVMLRCSVQTVKMKAEIPFYKLNERTSLRAKDSERKHKRVEVSERERESKRKRALRIAQSFQIEYNGL